MTEERTSREPTRFQRACRALHWLTVRAEELHREFGGIELIAAMAFLHGEHLDAIPPDAKAEALRLADEIRSSFEELVIDDPAAN